MNTLELMDNCTSSYSKTDRAIYEAIRKFPDKFASQSVTDIALSGGFSKPALTRFAKRLGFSGFVEFQFQFAQDLEQMRAQSDAPTNAEVYGDLLRTTEKRIDCEQLRRLLSRMEESHHVYVMGYNLSRIPAEALSIALTFHPSITASVPQVDIRPRFRPDDLLLVYSAVSGGSYKELLGDMRMGRNERPYMVLVSTNSKHPLRRNFDEVIVLPTATLTSTSHTVLSDTFSFLMFNDILDNLASEGELAQRENVSIETDRTS